jgi:hypothetical protein
MLNLLNLNFCDICFNAKDTKFLFDNYTFLSSQRRFT